eukprot:CAMPEP_0184655776 /NCGR_PEP_ID=MMETSP0308-20130426/14414_1 /TAXON_ID=38269 /ORGANISM="Gloeochaete witrockiana, Strain SAG 46.84" /LENGTH=64 /DNA_ID=CAMNT_0027092511 /DNA_START=38 /DNA_END=232 /DNA_ORIENTATION=-
MSEATKILTGILSIMSVAGGLFAVTYFNGNSPSTMTKERIEGRAAKAAADPTFHPLTKYREGKL